MALEASPLRLDLDAKLLSPATHATELASMSPLSSLSSSSSSVRSATSFRPVVFDSFSRKSSVTCTHFPRVSGAARSGLEWQPAYSRALSGCQHSGHSGTDASLASLDTSNPNFDPDSIFCEACEFFCCGAHVRTCVECKDVVFLCCSCPFGAADETTAFAIKLRNGGGWLHTWCLEDYSKRADTSAELRAYQQAVEALQVGIHPRESHPLYASQIANKCIRCNDRQGHRFKCLSDNRKYCCFEHVVADICIPCASKMLVNGDEEIARISIDERSLLCVFCAAVSDRDVCVLAARVIRFLPVPRPFGHPDEAKNPFAEVVYRFYLREAEIAIRREISKGAQAFRTLDVQASFRSILVFLDNPDRPMLPASFVHDLPVSLAIEPDD